MLWNSGVEANKEIVRKQKRKLSYLANIYVVSDPSNPENEGKVFLYKFGKKIFDKIMDVMQPQFQDEQPVNPFDFWAGCNFKLKIRNVEGYRNYDKSEFDKPSELFDGDEARLEETYGKLYSLSDFTDPANYKSYADLKRKLIEVIGAEAAGATVDQKPVYESTHASTSRVSDAQDAPSAETSYASSASDEEDDGESLSYFAKLAQG